MPETQKPEPKTQNPQAKTPKLTDRQAEVLGHIKRLIEANGYAPTIRELATCLGITSTNGVETHLVELERKGLITRTPGRSRSLKLASTERTVDGLRALVGSMAELCSQARDALAIGIPGNLDDGRMGENERAMWAEDVELVKALDEASTAARAFLGKAGA